LPPALAGGLGDQRRPNSALERGFSKKALAMLSTSGHVFSELLAHLNWHCKDDRPLIDPAIEARLYGFIENYCMKCKGVRFIAVGGTVDHVHLLIQHEPFICLADWVGKIKGASAHEMNEKASQGGGFQWQRGYGAVSFAKHDIDGLMKYVAEQKRHHEQGKVNRTLEQFGTFEEKAPEGALEEIEKPR
jgi:putative transposase